MPYTHDGKTDNGIDQIGVGVDSTQNTSKQRDAVTNGEKAHVLDNIFQPIEEEYDANKEQNMIVASHHMLCAEIQERRNCRAAIRLDECRITLRYVVRGDDCR
jgi:hypothetical protein